MNLKKSFQVASEQEDSNKVLYSSIQDHMNADMEKHRTVECLMKGLTPMTLTFYQLLLQMRSSLMNFILRSIIKREVSSKTSKL